MNHTGKALLALLVCAGFAGVLLADPSADLFAKTHKGEKESKVASDWYDNTLRAWVTDLTHKNKFPQTHLTIEITKVGDDGLGRAKNSKEVNKFEIRDIDKRGRQFTAYLMTPNGVDGQGHTVYAKTQTHAWVPFKSWPAKYIVETYPVESNPNANDLVAFGAWLYGEKENDLANRVLTVAHDKDAGLAPLIEAYICDKEKWDLPKDGMKVWNAWDKEYQKERQMMVTPDEYDKRLKQREKDAEQAFKDLEAARGDYKGRPPRRRGPTKMLVLLQWDLKQYKITYGSSDFIKDAKVTDKLQEIQDSITDDLATIKDNLEKARKMGEDGDSNKLKDKAEFMEQILAIDPMDLNLHGQVAEAWYTWAKVDQYGNNCDHSLGLKNAIPHYEKIIEAYPNNTAFLLRIGKCWQALQESSKARPYYEKIIEICGDAKGDGRLAKAGIRNMDLKDQNRQKTKGN